MSGLYGHSITYFDGDIYLFGGTTGLQYFRHFFKYSLVSKEWQDVVVVQNSSMPEARYKHTAHISCNALMILGGVN